MPVLEGSEPEFGGRAKPEEDEKSDYSMTDDLSAMMKAISLGDGSYGIDKKRWATLATGAGVGGANIDDRMAKIYVVGYWLNRYHESLKNWGLVAVAWTSGMGTARAIAKQANKEPAAVNEKDIMEFAPEAYKAARGIISKTAGLMAKGWTEGVDEPMPLNQPAPRTTITGTGNIYQEDRYALTVRELQAEQEAERKSNAPSGAEMLFAQLESLSGVVSGGEGRVDWRSDFSEAESGGDVQQMEELKRPGE